MQITDYTDIIFEELISQLPEEERLMRKRLVNESNYILSCLEEGKILEYVDEATSEKFKKAQEALKSLLEKLHAKFMAASVKFYESYIDGVTKHADEIIEKAKKETRNMAPYNAVNPSSGMTELTGLYASAFEPKYTDGDIKFISTILPSVKDLDTYKKMGNDEIRTRLKNHFRFGKDESDTSKISKNTFKEAELASLVSGTIIPYVKGYKAFAEKVKANAKGWQTNANEFTQANMESVGNIAKDTYFLIEDTNLYNTDLSLLEGFAAIPDTLLEADENTSQPSGQDSKAAEQKKEGEKDVKSIDNPDKPKDDNKSPNEQKQENTKKQGADERYTLADTFCQLAYGSYLFACEERFVVYTRMLQDIYGGSLKSGDEKKEEKKEENK